MAFASDDIDATLDAALARLGVARVMRSAAVRHEAASGALVAAPEDRYPSVLPNRLYHPCRRHMSAAPRAFIRAVRAGGS